MPLTNPIANAKYMNKLNKIRVLSLIRNAGDPLSRADAAKASGLSAPTISRIVEDLIAEGLVREVGEGVSQGGRRPTLLRFSDEDNFIIGIDLGTTNIYGVLSDFKARVIHEIRRPTQVREGFQRVMERTGEVIDDLIRTAGNGRARIHGIGLAVAGLINRQRNIVEFSPDFRWHNVDVLGALAPAYDIPLAFDNVTRVMALGELWFGLGRTVRNLICVNAGYGIGAGVIINGRPLYGPLGMAGEFGHITLDKDSRLQCDCGNYGCLEALASGNAIAKTAQAALAAGATSILRDMAGGDVSAVTAEMVADAAKRGDATAWEVFDRAMDFLGVGIAALINLFSPEAVVIGGGVAQSGDILFEKVRKTVLARSLGKIASGVLIRPATFGLRAAVIGAVSLILSEVVNLNYEETRPARSA